VVINCPTVRRRDSGSPKPARVNSAVSLSYLMKMPVAYQMPFEPRRMS